MLSILITACDQFHKEREKTLIGRQSFSVSSLKQFQISPFSFFSPLSLSLCSLVCLVVVDSRCPLVMEPLFVS